MTEEEMFANKTSYPQKSLMHTPCKITLELKSSSFPKTKDLIHVTI